MAETTAHGQAFGTWSESLKLVSVNFINIVPCKRPSGGIISGPAHGAWREVLLGLALVLGSSGALAHSQPNAIDTSTEDNSPGSLERTLPSTEQSSDQEQTGTIRGAIVDKSGTAVAGARVKLTRERQTESQEAISNEDGQFSFIGITPGPFQLSIAASGFAAGESSGAVRPGENFAVPQVVLTVATNITEVRVELSPIEIAQEQLKDQEQQRVLGFIPNFYVSYIPDAAPLSSKQKYQLAWKTTVDPVSFGLTGAVAGIEQAQNRFSGYGQGADGYAKRYGATYADFAISTFIGGAILPSLFKQDPRYFYKGTGSTKSRVMYALANAVICKGDNGHWQANYSQILGDLAAGGISNLYYPASDRNGAALTFENTLISIGASAASNLLQEFVLKKLSTHVPHSAPSSVPNTLATP